MFLMIIMIIKMITVIGFVNYGYNDQEDKDSFVDCNDNKLSLLQCLTILGLNH